MIIYNHSNATYNYTLPGGPTQSGSQDSNTVQTEVVSSLITMVKSSDSTFLAEGETALQTIVFTNNSSVNMTSLSFTDTMSAGAGYVAGTVRVNGVSQPTYDPATGFALPDIPAGGSTTITYNIIANNPKTNDSVVNSGALTYPVMDPVRGPITYTGSTNDVTIALVSARMTVVKSVDKTLAVRGDTLTYTSVVTNTGSLTKTNLVFRDVVPAGTTFVPGSVTIDGISYPAYNPTTGFPLSDLVSGAGATVVFSVKVV